LVAVWAAGSGGTKTVLLCEYLGVPTAGPDTEETTPLEHADPAPAADTTPKIGWDRLDWGISVVVSIATVFVHPVNLMLSHPYWLDEAWVAVLTRTSWSRLPGLSLSTPVGFAALLKLVPGTGMQRARLVVLAFSVLTAAFAYVFGRSLAWASKPRARFAGVAAALIAMLAPLSLGRNDLKQYTSDAFCAVLLLTVATWVDRPPQRTPVWWLTVASLATLPFSSTSAFVSVAVFGGLFISALLQRDRRRIIRVAIAGSATAIGLAAYFGAVVLPNTNEKLRAYWNAYYLDGSPLHVAHVSWTRLSHLARPLGMPALAFVALFAVGILTLNRLRAHAIAIAVPLLWIEMVAIGRLRRYPFLELRTSHFLLVASLVIGAVGVAGVVQLAYTWKRIVGIVAGAALAALFTTSIASDIDKLHIPLEGARSQAAYVAAHRAPDDVILVNGAGSYAFAYYWPHGAITTTTDLSVGQGFRVEVTGLGAVYASGRSDAEVADALRAGLTLWRAAPRGSRLYIVRSHVSRSELLAWP